eukprot:GGOE01004571.1.p1 GENE.GGOE01004571.1~~GGOE01004571.1.p1  ORF type:complete len:589 (+),score=203.44 GGOE01004571.1:63-1829(+)
MLFPILFLAHILVQLTDSAVLRFGPDVAPVTDQRMMQSQVLGDQFVWLVLFYKSSDPGSHSLQEVWDAVAKKSRGYLQVGAVDVEGQFGASFAKDIGMQQTPTILAFPSAMQPGARAGAQVRLQPYQGPLKVDSIVSFGVKLLPENTVARIKSAEQLDAFLAPLNLTAGPPAPKVLLLTNKDRTSPLYKGFSLHYVQRLLFGEARLADAPDICKRFGVDTFPTMMVFHHDEGEDPKTFSGEKFDFHSLSNFLKEFALTDEQLKAYVEQKEELLARKEEERKAKEEEEARLASLRDLNPTLRLHTAALWEQQVLEKGGITLVAWLDPNAERHKEYLRTLKKVWRRVQSGGTKFHFVWVDGEQQRALAEHFGAAGNLPVVTFLHAKNGWWKQMIGAFEEDKIWRYARDQLLRGGGKELMVASLPPFVEEENVNGLQELDPEEEATLLSSKPGPPKAAKEKGAPPAASAQPPATQEEGASQEKAPAKAKAAEGVEERNRQREAEKATQRRANEERRQQEKAEREAKLEAERQARHSKQKKNRKGPGADASAEAEKRPPTVGAKAGTVAGEPGAVPTNAYFEALKRRQREEL